MQRYMYIEKGDQAVNESNVHGIFVPIDSPIEFTLDKLEDGVLIRLTMGSYEYLASIDRPTKVHIDEHYDWCKEGTVDIITWFLSTDIKVFDCILFFLSFEGANPLKEFKNLCKNNL